MRNAWKCVALSGCLFLTGLPFAVPGNLFGKNTALESAPTKLHGAAFAETSPAMHKSGQFYGGTVIASDPSIEMTPDGLVMLYTDLDLSTGRTVIARAVSSNGIDWSTEGESGGIKGLAMAGQPDSWDQNVESAELVQNGAEWQMFFAGYRDEGSPAKGFPAALWLATSTDGRSFTRVSDEPVMLPTSGWYDNDAIYSPTILFDGSTYHMIYVGHSYSDFSLIGAGGVYMLYASSQNGRDWTKAAEPVARPGQFADWRRDGLAEPWLLPNPAGGYLLFYTGLDGEKRTIGMATGPSPTGPWDFGTLPLVDIGAQGERDEHQVLAPSAVVQGDTLSLWYLAADGSGALTIGFADGPLADAIATTR